MAEMRESNRKKYIPSSEALFVRSKILEYCKESCFDLTPGQVDTVLELAKEYKTLPRSKPTFKSTTSIGMITVDIDVSDALKGLKAVTREAKKATAALKELEIQQDKVLKG